ncbi:hypothetical protein WK24_12995 [Burkholderia vietnamiensis]|uniref:right-handed parallel beta-helix repeat-containing protein n=1 Tax=Burkholderia vietnamiensis TaxID=60552 RepID=UPI000755D7D0|nr:right-handed parallel beta-helix repeat-containing protein [Burkholderia vietnamiensis]KVR68557.1 hypothetical protein WK24_12995 [Burkholderia vietnamiensis]
MTVASDVQDVTYTTDGVSTVFPIPFYFLENTDIVVDKFSSNGARVRLVFGTDYTLQGAGNESGGALTTLATFSTGFRLHVYREVPITQETEYQQNDPFPAKTTEKALDKLTMIDQQLQRSVANAIRFPADEFDKDGTLASAAARASRILGFDDNGNVTLLPIPASVGAGDMRDDIFVAGTDFTPGTTTSLTLSRPPGSMGNVAAHFDGVYQGPDAFTLSGQTITFGAPIPVGVNEVYIRLGTTLSVYTPPDGSVTDVKVAPGAAIDSAKLSYKYGFPTSRQRTVSDRFSEIISLKDFCSGDPLDMAQQAGFTQWLTALQAGSGEGYIPDGTYNLNTYNIISDRPVSIRGSQRAILNNVNVGLSGPLLHFTSTATTGTELEGFTLQSAGLLTPAAAGLQFDGGRDFTIRDITVSGFYRGMLLAGAQFGGSLDGCFVFQASEDGYLISDGNLSIANCYAINNGGKGFHFTTTAGSAGITMANCTAFNNSNGNFAFNGGAGAGIQDVYLANCVASATSNGDGYLFDTYGKNIQIVGCFSELAGCNSSGVPINATNGFHFTSTNHRVTLTGCQATFSGGAGARMDCGYFSICGGDFTANSVQAYGAYPGISVGAAGPIGDFTITGANTVYDPGLDVNSQAYGINFGSVGNVNGVVAGNVLSGTSGPIGGLAGNPGIKARANAGYINEAAGVITIPSGSTSVSVTHGMSVIPTTIQLSVLDASGPTGLVASSGTRTSYGFTVWLSSASGSNVNVSWSARGAGA